MQECRNEMRRISVRSHVPAFLSNNSRIGGGGRACVPASGQGEGGMPMVRPGQLRT